MIKIDECIICGSDVFTYLFSKSSILGEEFILVKCDKCRLKFLLQVPDESEIRQYYKKEYFLNRTERGYNNYFSDSTRNEIRRVIDLNLRDLKFFEFEKKIPEKRYSLDIGCAAGYFVEFLDDRGWYSYGIDVSDDCVEFVRNSGLRIFKGDYLKKKFKNKFDLVTLWATIEHLHKPDMILKKRLRFTLLFVFMIMLPMPNCQGTKKSTKKQSQFHLMPWPAQMVVESGNPYGR